MVGPTKIMPHLQNSRTMSPFAHLLRLLIEQGKLSSFFTNQLTCDTFYYNCKILILRTIITKYDNRAPARPSKYYQIILLYPTRSSHIVIYIYIILLGMYFYEV